MGIALDAAYALLAAATAPWWLRKKRDGWPERFGRIDALPPKRAPRLLVHAVSVGEVNLTRPLIERLIDAGVEPVVSATTDTGITRARALYNGTCPVVRYPLDASWAVRRFLDAVRPDAVALVELELWPHFVGACRRREIPVAVVNGRLSARSFRNYRACRAFVGKTFRALAFAGVQDEDYAERFRAMGVAPERVHVAGSMKWDAAQVLDRVEGADRLAALLGIDRSRPLLVAGSTAPGEHELLHAATPPGVQLLCAPRKPEWYDAAAEAMPGCVRRSEPNQGDPASGRFLLDSIGELRLAYDLADVVVVGRSFGALYGSDPMEPAALARPIVIGPAFEDFRAPVLALERAGAIVLSSPESIGAARTALFAHPERRAELARNARQCVLDHQGAADRHTALLLDLMGVRADGGRACPAPPTPPPPTSPRASTGAAGVGRPAIAGASLIVVKVGTAVLTGGSERLDRAFMHDLASQVAALVAEGRRVILVSSGAVGAGLGAMALPGRPSDVTELQAAAAAGQPLLMSQWHEAFGVRGLGVAQILVGRADFDSRERFLNIRNCLGCLNDHRIVPIVNENDSVATEEISLGDNDILAAKLASAMRADLLVILTTVAGVETSTGQVLDRAEDAERLVQLIRTERSAQGRGGMRTKIEAARIATRSGTPTIIGPGRPPGSLASMLAGESLGTLILGREARHAGRRLWIAMTATPVGAVTVDAGAAGAITQRGASLLAKGVTRFTGRFGVGDVVSIVDASGAEIARGLTNFTSEELAIVKGRASSEFEALLGRQAHDEIIHRDNMATVDR